MDWDSNIIKQASKDFAPLDDGYIYYWPSRGGALSAHTLRIIADELDKRNKEWDDDIRDYFATRPDTEEEEGEINEL